AGRAEVGGSKPVGSGGAGYSGTPLARKLGITEGASVVVLGAPEGFGKVLAPLPDGVRVSRRLPRKGRQADVAVLFATAGADLEHRFDAVAAALTPAGGLWVAWPKRSSGVPTDLTENVIRDIGVAHGMVDNKVCAVTDVWSGLRFVLRLKDRPRG
ncbi:MAG TPA: hypothetical protein VG455_01260, partial [Acidimicrobiales bacterium]|nr:hypothetical protein [Acidimicrobiales bacterium]